MSITIIGLGPGAANQLTREAWDVLSEASEVYLRTNRHPTLELLAARPNLRLHSFDDLYETIDDFATVYRAISEQVLSLGTRPGGVVYAVPGNPYVGEATTSLIVQGAASAGLPVRIVAGLSFLEPLLAAVHLDALDGLQVADAMGVAARYHAPLDPDRPAVLAQLYSRLLAGEVKLVLLDTYPAEHPVTLVRAAGTSDQYIVTRALYQLDHESFAFDHLTSLLVPPLDQAGGYGALEEIVAHLRAPDGCPWDREQTHESLTATLLEEAYEVVAAIEGGDRSLLAEELGDLLLNVAMQVQCAAEEGTFRLADVVSHIVSKLIRRHPHVFGDVAVQNVNDVLQNWDAIKEAERRSNGAPPSALGSVPKALPALMQAQTYQRRAARIGWQGFVREATSDAAPHDEAALGDTLFYLAWLAGQNNWDAEQALRQANTAFAVRVAEVERQAQENGLRLGEADAATQAMYWTAHSAEPAGK